MCTIVRHTFLELARMREATMKINESGGQEPCRGCEEIERRKSGSFSLGYALDLISLSLVRKPPAVRDSATLDCRD